MAPNYEGLRRMQDYQRRFTATQYTSTQLGQMGLLAVTVSVEMG